MSILFTDVVFFYIIQSYLKDACEPVFTAFSVCFLSPPTPESVITDSIWLLCITLPDQTGLYISESNLSGWLDQTDGVLICAFFMIGNKPTHASCKVTWDGIYYELVVYNSTKLNFFLHCRTHSSFIVLCHHISSANCTKRQLLCFSLYPYTFCCHEHRDLQGTGKILITH